MRRNLLWPPHRTAHNPQADMHKDTEESRNTKKDWSAQRSRMVTRTFYALNAMFPGRYCETGGDIGEAMFDGGRYGWLQFTAPVFAAVMAAYEGQAQIPKVLTGLMHLCEIMRYLPAKNEYYRLLEARKRIRGHATAPASDPTTAPSSPVSLDPADAARGAATAAAIEEVRLEYYGEMLSEAAIRRREEEDAAFEAYQTQLDREQQRRDLEWDLDRWAVDQMELGRELHVIQAVKDRNIAALDVSIAPSLEVRGTVHGRDDTAPAATSSIDVRVLAASVQSMNLNDGNESDASTLTLPSSDDEDETPPPAIQVSITDADNADAQMATTSECPTKPYVGRAPTAAERRDWEAAATAYYASLQNMYQSAIERLRVHAGAFMAQEGLDVSKWLGEKQYKALNRKLPVG